MRFAPSMLDEIKNKVTVSSVVSRKVQLKRAGREMRGLSPFNAEKTASFFVNDAKQAWFDFSSGRNGNVFDFVMATEGLTFPEAVERLADEAGVTIERGGLQRETAATKQLKTDVLGVLQATQDWYRLQFLKSERAQTYAAGRGIEPSTAEAFGIGYAPPSRFALRNHLVEAANYSMRAISASGVMVEGEDIAVPFSFMRDRLTFPIKDPRGRIVSFGGRALGDGVAKYLNGRETAIFDKGRSLFNLDRATSAIRKAGFAIIQEGYIDAITTAQSGIENVVASLGTALALEQGATLWRLAPKICICLDADRAGYQAGNRAFETLAPALAGDRRIAFVNLPAGTDPDSLIRANGPKALQGLVRTAEEPHDRLWRFIREKAPGDGPEARAQAQALIAEYIGPIGDPQLKREYQIELTNRARAIGKAGGKQDFLGDIGRDMTIPSREAAIAYAAAIHPTYAENDIERFSALNFTVPVTTRVASAVLGAITSETPLDQAVISRDLAVLAQRLPDPRPSFVSKLNPEGFTEAINLQILHQQQQRRRGA